MTSQYMWKIAKYWNRQRYIKLVGIVRTSYNTYLSVAIIHVPTNKNPVYYAGPGAGSSYRLCDLGLCDHEGFFNNDYKPKVNIVNVFYIYQYLLICFDIIYKRQLHKLLNFRTCSHYVTLCIYEDNFWYCMN